MVIIPALNEEKNIKDIVRQIKIFSDVIVVDDGSVDLTAKAAEDQTAIVLRLPKNYGYDGALSAGFNLARQLDYEFFVSFDADGQLPVDGLSRAYTILANGEAELVIGVRRNMKRWSEMLFNALVERRFGVADILCGLKGYSRALYEEYGAFSFAKSVGTELALFGLRRNYSLKILPIVVSKRTGRSRFGGWFTGHWKILVAMFRWLAGRRVQQRKE